MKIKNISLLSILTVLYVMGSARLEIMGIPSTRIFLLILISYCICLFCFNRRNMRFVYPGYVLFYLITVIVVNFFHLTLNNLIWSSLEIFLLLMIFPTLFRKEKDFYYIIDVFLFAGGILAILGIIETFTGFNLFDTLSGNYVVKYGANSLRFGLTRSRGFLTTSINNALFLGMSATLCAYRISTTKTYTQKKRLICVYILLLTNMISTMSRGVMIIFAIVQLIMWWKNKVITNPFKMLKIITAFAVALLMLNIMGIPVIRIIHNLFSMFAVIINPSYGESIASDFGMNLYGVGSRLQLFGLVWDAVKDNFVLGNGYQTHFSVRLTSTIVKTSIENTYLGYLYYGGFVGLMGILILLIGVIISSIRKSKRLISSESGMSFEWMMVLLTAAYAASLFTVYAVDDLRTFYFLIAMLFAHRRLLVNKSKDN